jgi:hypothetical protein
MVQSRTLISGRNESQRLVAVSLVFVAFIISDQSGTSRDMGIICRIFGKWTEKTGGVLI